MSKHVVVTEEAAEAGADALNNAPEWLRFKRGYDIDAITRALTPAPEGEAVEIPDYLTQQLATDPAFVRVFVEESNREAIRAAFADPRAVKEIAEGMRLVRMMPTLPIGDAAQRSLAAAADAVLKGGGE